MKAIRWHIINSRENLAFVVHTYTDIHTCAPSGRWFKAVNSVLPEEGTTVPCFTGEVFLRRVSKLFLFSFLYLNMYVQPFKRTYKQCVRL